MGLGVEYHWLRDPTKVVFYDSKHYYHDHVVFLRGLGSGHERPTSDQSAMFRNIHRWCREQYGRRGNRGSWNYFEFGICFRDQYQVFEFKVRWEGAATP